MNVPVVGNRVGPPMHRLESVTPNRLVSDYAEEQHRINMADEAATGDFLLQEKLGCFSRKFLYELNK
jgi:hypothetical protein